MQVEPKGGVSALANVHSDFNTSQSYRPVCMLQEVWVICNFTITYCVNKTEKGAVILKISVAFCNYIYSGNLAGYLFFFTCITL